MKRPPARKPLPLRVRLYIWVLAGSALALFTLWRHAWQGNAPTNLASWDLMVLLLALAVFASHLRLHVTRGRDMLMVNAAHFASLLLFGPVPAMVLAALSTAIGELTVSIRRHYTQGTRLRSLHQVLFACSQWTATTGIGGLVYYSFLPHTAPARMDLQANAFAAPATAVAMYLSNTWLVSGVVGLQRKENPLHIWLVGRRRDAIQEAGLFLLGLITARTAVQDPWMPLLMILPVAIVYVSLKRSVQLEEQTIGAVEALADIVDRRDHYTFEHSKRVADYAQKLARAMRLSLDEVETIRLAARVHDLGKIGVPDHVLRKAGPLTDDERELMNQHPEMGYEILTRFAEYRKGRGLVRHHHERYDGKGYPDALAGDRLALGARIIAVADAVDAMTSDRPYRKALPMDVALAELRRGHGVQWAPEVVDAFIRLAESGAIRIPGPSGQPPADGAPAAAPAGFAAPAVTPAVAAAAPGGTSDAAAA